MRNPQALSSDCMGPLGRRGPRAMPGRGKAMSVLGQATAALVEFPLGLNAASSKFLDFRETI